MTEPFFIFDGTSGDPATGLVPTFKYYRRRETDGSITTLTPPTIVERGLGLYEFTTNVGDAVQGTIISYLVDCGASALTRYQEGSINGDEAIASEDDVPATAAIQTFGVTYSTVRQDYFPQFTGEWSATSNPTSDTITRWIADAGADLAGRLRLKSMTALAIATGVDPASPTEAYAWCRRTIGLIVAVRVVPVQSAGGNGELETEWKDDLQHRFHLLEEHGDTVLGDGAAAAGTSPEGPTSHISQLNLDTGDPSLASDVIPRLRRSDKL